RDALRFIGSEEDKNIGYVSGIRPFRRILLGFGGAMHRRVHASGIDPIDAHIRVFQFRCPRLRHPFKAEFGNAVGAPAWVTDLAGVAGYVDDRTAALDHRRQGVLYQQKWADQICIEDSAEIFDRIIEQVWHWRWPNGGGVVHENVEMAFELGQGRRDNTLDVARFAHARL